MNRRMRNAIYGLAIVTVGLGAGAAADDVSECDLVRGEKLFQKCAVCHSFDASGANGPTGPNLYGVIGRKVGQAEGYKFSGALRKSGDVWSSEHLDAFLAQPMAMYPRTRMAFAGLKKERDRADVICFMASAP